MKSLDFHEITKEKIGYKKPSTKFSLLLDRPHNEMNIGHIFRLADAADIAHVYILNPTPTLNWNKIDKKSRSNSKHVPYSIIDDCKFAIDQFDQIIAVEWTDQSQSVFNKPALQDKVLLVVGNEQKGVDDNLLAYCNAALHIPMYGLHSSMNVAMATGIVVYQLIASLQE